MSKISKNKDSALSEAVYSLNRALVFTGVPAYAITLLTHALGYFSSNPDGATRLIVDVQREAYRRTQEPKAKRLAECLRRERSAPKACESRL